VDMLRNRVGTVLVRLRRQLLVAVGLKGKAVQEAAQRRNGEMVPEKLAELGMEDQAESTRIGIIRWALRTLVAAVAVGGWVVVQVLSMLVAAGEVVGLTQPPCAIGL